MSDEFESDRRRILEEAALAREELLTVVRSLSDADLDAQRRGGWTVWQVLQHVTGAEWYYAQGVAQLRDAAPPQPREAAARSPAGATEGLAASRAALLAASDGVDEETFYRMAPHGEQEWSVMSFLEGIADHDREHCHQIEALVRG